MIIRLLVVDRLVQEHAMKRYNGGSFDLRSSELRSLNQSLELEETCPAHKTRERLADELTFFSLGALR